MKNLLDKFALVSAGEDWFPARAVDGARLTNRLGCLIGGFPNIIISIWLALAVFLFDGGVLSASNADLRATVASIQQEDRAKIARYLTPTGKIQLREKTPNVSFVGEFFSRDEEILRKINHDLRKLARRHPVNILTVNMYQKGKKYHANIDGADGLFIIQPHVFTPRIARYWEDIHEFARLKYHPKHKVSDFLNTTFLHHKGWCITDIDKISKDRNFISIIDNIKTFTIEYEKARQAVFATCVLYTYIELLGLKIPMTDLLGEGLIPTNQQDAADITKMIASYLNAETGLPLSTNALTALSLLGSGILKKGTLRADVENALKNLE